jgi:orotate phosphoribosyltransferase
MEKVRVVPQEVRVQEILEQTGAVREGHFQYASGLHGKIYINKDSIFSDTELTSELGLFIAQKFQARNIDAVAGPQMGGLIIARDVAKHLSRMDYKKIHAVFAEKKEEELKFKRGYDELIQGKNILAVEDVLNTGGSAKKLIEAIRENGGKVVALGALVNRGNVKPQDVEDIPIHSLLNLNIERYSPEDCNQCKEGIPLSQNLGHAS